MNRAYLADSTDLHKQKHYASSFRPFKNIFVRMKNLALLLVVSAFFITFSCKKNTQSEPTKLLTGHIWVSDSLLANKVDASGPDGMLKNFKGEVKFNEDGSGNFGVYTGTWRFAYNETQIVITTDSLPLPLTTKIAELTTVSLKITTSYPNLLNPAAPTYIRMTFKAK
jgi:hypothetical protein